MAGVPWIAPPAGRPAATVIAPADPTARAATAIGVPEDAIIGPTDRDAGRRPIDARRRACR